MTKGDKTRLRIVETALECFYDIGVTETTFKTISTRSDLTQPGIYAYFKDMNSLLLACSEHAIERGRQFLNLEMPRDAGAREVLKDYLYANLKWAFRDRKSVHSLLAMYYFGATNPFLKKLHLDIDENSIGRVEGFLRAGNREKSWNVKNPNKVAREIHNLIVGEMIKIFHWPAHMGLDERHHDLWSFVLKVILT